MLRIYAHEYIRLGEKLHDLRVIFLDKESGGDISAEDMELIKKQLKELKTISTDLDLPVSAELIGGKLTKLPDSLGEYNLILDAMRAELRTKLFLFIPPHRARYFELVLQSTVTTAFPSASKEIVASGNCLASGFYTASVFHSMRAAEIGVRILGGTLGVSFPDKPIELAEWQNILDQADSKIVKLKELPRGTYKDEELKFYSQAAVQFRYFKDAWRVRVAHARETYEESPAIQVFTHTLEFFDTLATRLKESA